MKTYSTKSNAARAARAEGLDVGKLVFTQSSEGGWTYAMPAEKKPASGALATLVELLERPEGCTTKEAAKATGWKEHTCRARISSTIGKEQKRQITTEKVEGRGRVYRIAA
jgi:hypothetical protein